MGHRRARSGLCVRCSATTVLIGRCGASLNRDKLRLAYVGGVLVKSTFRNDVWLTRVIAVCFPERVKAGSITQRPIPLYLIRFGFF